MVENYISLYKKFKALKADIVPIDYIFILKVKKKYATLQKGPIYN